MMQSPITKHRFLSNEEFIRQMEDKRACSSIIDELCSRLEKRPTTCPVCEADFDKIEEVEGGN